MNSMKSEWDLPMAMEILQNPTVDRKLWSEAVEWLLLYGPEEIKSMLFQASDHATRESFPGLESKGYTDDGQPCFEIEELAKALGISQEEAIEKLKKLEKNHRVKQVYDSSETHKIQ
jgi:hypothetical protein